MQTAFNEERVELLLTAFIVFALSYYGYLYFYDFEEGVSAAPFAIKALKDVVYLAVAMTVAVMLCRTKPPVSHLAASLTFAPLAFVLLVTSIVHARHTSLSQQLWENMKNVALFIPVFSLPFFLRASTCEAITRKLFFTIVLCAGFQCLFVFVYHRLGGQLWLDGIYSGLIGNPNSFALLLNLSIAIILSGIGEFKKQKMILVLFSIAVITSIILNTDSGSQFIIFCGLIALSFFFFPNKWRFLGVVTITVVCVLLMASSNFARTTFAIKGLTTVLIADAPLIDPKPQASLSVSSRLADISDALSIFHGSPATLVFGSFDNASFRAMDGQFWVFLYNSGTLGFIAFTVSALFVYVRSLANAWNQRSSHAIGLHLMVVSFGVTFLASRVLMYFPFNFLFFLVAGLAVSASFRRPSSSKPL
jgi:hypothetical protein